MANEFRHAGQIERIIKNAHMEGAAEIGKAADQTERFTEAQKHAAEALQQMTAPYEAAIARIQRLADTQSAARKQWEARMAPYQNATNNVTTQRVEAIRRSAAVENPFVNRLRQAAMGSMLGGGRDRRDNGQNQPQDDPLTARVKNLMKVYRATTIAQALPGRIGEFAKNLPNGMFSRHGASYEGALEKLPPGAAQAAIAVGFIATAGKKVYDLGVQAERAARASAEYTQRMTDLHHLTGGTSMDAGRAAILSRITGVDAGGAARSFNERITSDPFAMGMAARFGISNTPGIYGRRNFGQQYQNAIARVSAIRDRDERERTAEALGIGQEVNRYRFLGPESRQRMQRIGQTTGLINNPEAERRAAEYQSAIASEAQARQNLTTAFGQAFGGGPVKLINALADIQNTAATRLFEMNKFYDRFKIGSDKHYGDRIDSALRTGDIQTSGGTGDSGNGMTLQAQQLQATRDLTAALLKNAGVYGGGDRSKNAIPRGVSGANLHRALVSGGIRLGYL